MDKLLYNGQKIELLKLIIKYNNNLIIKNIFIGGIKGNNRKLSKNQEKNFKIFEDIKFGRGGYKNKLEVLKKEGLIENTELNDENSNYMTEYKLTLKGNLFLKNSNKFRYRLNLFIEDYKWIPILISLFALLISIIAFLKK